MTMKMKMQQSQLVLRREVRQLRAEEKGGRGCEGEQREGDQSTHRVHIKGKRQKHAQLGRLGPLPQLAVNVQNPSSPPIELPSVFVWRRG